MEQKQKVFITVIVLVLIVAAFYGATKAITQYTGYAVNNNLNSTNINNANNIVNNRNSEDNNPISSLDDFAKCLTDKNAVVYGAYWCPHCQNQKKTLGDSSYIPYIECAEDGKNAQPEKCRAAGIQGYPTWQIKGILYNGEKNIEELSKLTGCEI